MKYNIIITNLLLPLGHISNTHLCSTRAQHQRIKPRLGATVGECSNFKKIPMHTQDHGDALQREGRVLSTYPRRPKADALEQRG